jgi:hypothetical protein
VWVVRGTDAPLAKVFQSVADGHPVAEIAEFFEITPLQLLTVLQFAARVRCVPLLAVSQSLVEMRITLRPRWLKANTISNTGIEYGTMRP